MSKDKVVVAMSGGVDSSVAAAQANLAIKLSIKGPDLESIDPLRSIPIVGGR